MTSRNGDPKLTPLPLCLIKIIVLLACNFTLCVTQLKHPLPLLAWRINFILLQTDVVYFNPLLCAMRTQKLVELLFFSDGATLSTPKGGNLDSLLGFESALLHNVAMIVFTTFKKVKVVSSLFFSLNFFLFPTHEKIPP